MRSKEEAHDYRYFPDPDLLPLEITMEYVEKLKNELPELPDEKKHRFMREFGLSDYDADVLISERASADFFEEVVRGRDRVVAEPRDGKVAANWVNNELFGRLNKEGLSIEASPVSAAQLGAIVDLISSGTISGKIAKDLFEIVWSEGGDPAAIVESPRHEAGHRHRAPSRRRSTRSSPPTPTRWSRSRPSPPCSAGSSAR